LWFSAITSSLHCNLASRSSRVLHSKCVRRRVWSLGLCSPASRLCASLRPAVRRASALTPSPRRPLLAIAAGSRVVVYVIVCRSWRRLGGGHARGTNVIARVINSWSRTWSSVRHCREQRGDTTRDHRRNTGFSFALEPTPSARICHRLSWRTPVLWG
jgi:hypothetical protein